MKIYPNLTGWSLILGGVLYLITNTVLTLLMPQDVPGAELFASDAFLRRLSVAAATVFFLTAGAIGIYVRQSHKTGWFGGFAFLLAFTGNIITFAHEWGQVFFLHELARVAPEGLNALEDVEGPNLYDIETFLALGFFMFGWLLLGVSMLMARVFKPAGPALLIAGFFLVPILGASLPGLWGFAAGNVVVALGWILIGRDLAGSDNG